MMKNTLRQFVWFFVWVVLGSVLLVTKSRSQESQSGRSQRLWQEVLEHVGKFGLTGDQRELRVTLDAIDERRRPEIVRSLFVVLNDRDFGREDWLLAERKEETTGTLRVRDLAALICAKVLNWTDESVVIRPSDDAVARDRKIQALTGRLAETEKDRSGKGR